MRNIKALIPIFTLFTVLLLFNTKTKAQIYAPEGLNMPGSWNSWTNPPTNLAFAGNTQTSGGRVGIISNLSTQPYQTIFSTPTDVAAGAYEFAFSSGPSTNYWANKWTNGTFTMNSLENLTFNSSVNNTTTLNNNKYYVMNWENSGYVDSRAIFMELSAQPVSFTNITRTPQLVQTGETVTVTATLSGSKSTEEKIYLRYTTNAWANSTLVAFNVSGTTATADIPAQSSGAIVEYYAFSTVISSPAADFDLYTIHFINNNGDNYTYTVGQEITCDSQTALITTSPVFPIEDQAVTITFNAALGNQGLIGYTGTVYAHTGVITNLSTSNSDWKHTIGTWGNNTIQPSLTNVGTDLYQLTISNIRTFYSVTDPTETIEKMAFVFRSATATSGVWKEGKNTDGSDILVEVYLNQLNVKILSPNSQAPIIDTSDIVPICITGLNSESIKVYFDTDLITTETTENITLPLIASEYSGGQHNIIAVASKAGETDVRDTVSIFIRENQAPQEVPVGMKKGINYNTNGTSVTLVLNDPAKLKQFVFVVGDFNNWTPDNESYMKRNAAGDYYWTTITGLTPETEYAYQYYIDEELKIADPYCDKVLDPWNDKYINSTTYPNIYPNLKPYPSEKTTGIVSVLETEQADYDWVVDNFTPVAVGTTQSNLVIYELLIRDFVSSRAIKDVQAKLDYLQELGVNAIELMPFNEFEGNDSWGYNPSFYFAPDKAYGTKNDYKAFIDACHQRGIAVIMDMVLNHSYGQSPMVQMYMDGNYNPTAENPWYNQVATHPYSVGSDFNHESLSTRQFCKDVMTYWMTEYKIDGYRFDLSKGFTQFNSGGNVGLWSDYDQSRVNIWQDYYNHIKSVNSNAYVILEHLSDNDEEVVLAGMGLMLWGNMNNSFNQNTMGWTTNCDFSWANYAARGFSYPNLIPYMESHDEERLMYNNITNGASGTTSLNTALARTSAIVPFYFGIPGPKMIWQFGELGYDFSINRCSNGTISEDCRTSAKPVRWDYFTVAERRALYQSYQNMSYLKTNYEAFRNGTYSADLDDLGKRMWISHSSLNVAISANFSTSTFDMQPSFQHDGTWYDYYTGQSFTVSNPGGHTETYEPGEFHVFIDQPVSHPVTDINNDLANIDNILIYPNPTQGILNIKADTNFDLLIYDISGRLMKTTKTSKNTSLDISNLKKGIYFFKFMNDNLQTVKKITVN